MISAPLRRCVNASIENRNPAIRTVPYDRVMSCNDGERLIFRVNKGDEYNTETARMGMMIKDETECGVAGSSSS